MKHSRLFRLFKYFVLLLVLFCFRNTLASELHTDAFQQFRAAEEQSWRDYMSTYRDTRQDTSIDIRFYHVSIDVAVHKKYIKGAVEIRFDILQDNLEQIRLDLHRAFQIDSLRGSVSTFNFENDELRVTLNRAYSRGESASLHIFYQGEPQLINDLKGLRYEKHGFNEPVIANLSTPFLAHYWWPCKDGPGDKADSVYVDVTIPDTTIRDIPLIAVSNGKLERISAENGKKTFYWRERHPIVPYYVNIAIANYTPFRQWSRGGPTKGTPIEYNVFAETQSAAIAGFKNFPEVFDFFTDIFGPYPFKNEKYAMCELGYYGAIEKQTNTIMGGMTEDWFGVGVHELAHMWFGDMITCQSWHHGWLNEGFATYAEALWLEHRYGFDIYKRYMQNIRFFEGGTTYLQKTSDPFQIFISIIYNKGAWVLHMLRGVVGDEIFFDILKSYAADPRFRFDHATTKDFQQVCEDISGLDLDVFFDQWIYDEYFPFYEYSYWKMPEENIWNVRIEQIQGELDRRPVFEMPLRIYVHFQDGNDSTLVMMNDQRTQDYSFEFGKSVSEIKLDPDEWVLRKVRLQTIVGNSQHPPKNFWLQNYPNPFNSSTLIRFHTPEQTNINLVVQNMLGQQVRTLLRQKVEPGEHKVRWNGSNEQGEKLPSGVYFIVLQTPDDHHITRALLLQ